MKFRKCILFTIVIVDENDMPLSVDEVERFMSYQKVKDAFHADLGPIIGEELIDFNKVGQLEMTFKLAIGEIRHALVVEFDYPKADHLTSEQEHAIYQLLRQLNEVTLKNHVTEIIANQKLYKIKITSRTIKM